MHYHLEIIMPPTENVKETIEEILAPFDENSEDQEVRSSHAFWDWWVIGGRYSGQHIVGRYDSDKMDSFYADLKKHKVTVSGFVFGKEELSPASQIPLVDDLWQTHFDDNGPCPLFKHYNDQYADNYGDICQVQNMPEYLSCGRIIITGADFKPEFMIQTEFWNGVTWMDTNWDGSVKSAVEMYSKKQETMNKEWAKKNSIQPNWLLVTVDYHS